MENIINQKKQDLIKTFGISAKDCGSSAIQVALFTQRIMNLTLHLKDNKKDFQCKRGLLKLISKRNHHLAYLKRTNQELFLKVKKELKIRG
ncbi:30S ribosomal protein S15 [symbiont of Argiope bruennichi]|uniref:30S ribosomal protein S15 n=1 Tax=symbiont of Argiope bruennichi TaxID=2810479 RepID=UPI003DA1CA63